jgi:anaerobic selenocysteine-containing dehydrogenase
MSASDIRRLGLEVDQRVRVRSAAGALSNVLVREFDIRAGNAAMYYPEANTLVPMVADPQSGTPPFKSVLVTIEPDSQQTDSAAEALSSSRLAAKAAAAPARNLKAC